MGTDPRRRLVLMNLDDTLRNEDVRALFECYGRVVQFNRPQVAQFHRPPVRGPFAFATFEDASCATAAMKKMKDTGLRVHYAKDQKPPVGPANIKSLLATMIRNGYAFFVTQTSRLHRLHISFCFDTKFSLIRITNAGPRVLEKIRLPPRQLNAMVKRAKLWLPPLRIGGRVAVIDSKNMHIMLTNEKTIQDCGAAAENKIPFKPNNGDKCLVRIREVDEISWFRAICLCKRVSKARVRLLDFGNYKTVDADDIREFDPKCEFPSLTAICRIKGAVPLDERVKLADNLKLLQRYDVQQEDGKLKFAIL